MTMVINSYGVQIDYDAAVELMDEEIREEVAADLAPCTEQEFFTEYATTHTMADAELALLKIALTEKTFELPICVDVEENKITKVGKQVLTDLTAYALGKIESWGFYALLYTGLNFAQNNLYMGGAALKPYFFNIVKRASISTTWSKSKTTTGSFFPSYADSLYFMNFFSNRPLNSLKFTLEKSLVLDSPRT
mgnify:CR=1 FL=1